MNARQTLRGLRPERAAFVALLAIMGLNLLWFGPGMGGDTPTYLLWADRLRASHFDLIGEIRAFNQPAAITYSLFVTLLALLRMLGPAWLAGLLVLNLVAMAAVGALVVRLVVRITGDRRCGWIALVLLLACHDLWQWSRYLLSDPIFLLLAYGVFLMEARRLLGVRKRWLTVFAASAVASLFRPTGIVMFPITAWSFLLANTANTRLSRRRILAGLVVIGALGLGLFGAIVQAPGHWPLGPTRPLFDLIASDYAKGQVVWDRLETFHASPQGLTDVWLISLDRLWHYFAIGAAGFSHGHWLVNLVFFVPTYALAGYFVVRLVGGRSRLGRGEQNVCYAALGAIVFYALFHGAIQVDYDWRYRVPILPHLILLAACGAGELFAGRREVQTG